MIGPTIKLLKATVRSQIAHLHYLATGRRFRQLVVCGYPRSGTSLLYNMLSTSVEGFRFEPFEVSFKYRVHRLGDIATKYPLDVFELPRHNELNTLSKELGIVALVRDPRDVITSRHPVIPDRYFIGHDWSWWPQDNEFEEWKYDAPGLVPIYHAIRELEDCRDFSMVTVAFEDLIAQPDLVQNRLSRDLDLKFGASFSDFHERQHRLAYRYEGRGRPRDPSLVRENKPVDRSRAGKWASPEHSARIRDQFTSCPELFEIVRALGYEEDDAWYDGLTSSSDTDT